MSRDGYLFVVATFLELGALVLAGCVLAGCASNAPIPIDAGLFQDAGVIDAAPLVDAGGS